MNSERHNNWEIFHVLKHARGGGIRRGKNVLKTKQKKGHDHKPVFGKYQAPTLIRV
jgi:hypothetical protein